MDDVSPIDVSDDMIVGASMNDDRDQPLSTSNIELESKAYSLHPHAPDHLNEFVTGSVGFGPSPLAFPGYGGRGTMAVFRDNDSRPLAAPRNDFNHRPSSQSNLPSIRSNPPLVSSPSSLSPSSYLYSSGGVEGGVSLFESEFLFDQSAPSGRARAHSKFHESLDFQTLQKMRDTESLDYHFIDNELTKKERWNQTRTDQKIDRFQRWIIMIFIGLVTGLTAFLVHFGVDHLVEVKLEAFEPYMHKSNYAAAWIIYLLINLTYLISGTLLIVFLAPAASGSGVPDVKAFLNGVKVPKAVNVKTFVVKVWGVITAVAAGLPVGPEGPMIHIGGMIGGAISQPRSKTLRLELPFIAKFCSDKDRRDFIASGAACGVAAAFGAPLGGILFSIEEAASFWTPSMTWRTFFGCMMATFTGNFLLSGVFGHSWGTFSSSELIVFNVGTTAGSSEYRVWELALFALLGVVGGFSGALFTVFNAWICKWRRDHIMHSKARRIIEVVVLSVVISTITFLLPFLFECRSAAINPDAEKDNVNTQFYKTVQFNCADEYYNDMATMVFTTPSAAFRALISRSTYGLYSPPALITFFLIYFVLAAIVAGSSMSTGLMVPFLLIGSVYGRLMGHLLRKYSNVSVDPGVYALLGASSFFGGTSRMTISLCVIMLEITNDIQFLPPIMLTVMIAKSIGDYFTHPLYDILMNYRYLPFLESEPSPDMEKLTAGDVMSADIKFFPLLCPLENLITVLRITRHNGFPVVASTTDRRLQGLILRKYLLVLLKRKIWISKHSNPFHNLAEFRALINLPEENLENILSEISKEDLNNSSKIIIDLSAFINRSPFSVHGDFVANYAFRLFRSMGLRHLPVVNDSNEIIGMITRKDLLDPIIEAKYEMKLKEKGLLH